MTIRSECAILMLYLLDFDLPYIGEIPRLVKTSSHQSSLP